MYRKPKSLSHTSRPNSYWIIGEQQASEWGSTAKRCIYSQAAAVRVRWLPLPPSSQKNLPDLHQSQEWSLSGKSGVDMSTPVHPVATPLVVTSSSMDQFEEIPPLESSLNFQEDACNICHISSKCYHFTLQNGKQ